MKRSLYTLTLFLIISFITFFFSFILLWIGVPLNTPSYYANKENYEELVVKIEEFYSDDGTLYILLDGNLPSYEEKFKIIPSNEIIIKENGFYKEISEGDTITIVSAPRYFGDGYVYPIVGVKTDTKEYLNFDTGVLNQVDYEQESKESFLKIFIPIISISAISFTIFIVLQIRYNKKYKRQG